MDAEQRGQHLRRIITTVKEAVNNRVVASVNTEKVTLYCVSKLEVAETSVVVPSARLDAVKANLKIGVTAAALINKKARENISYYRQVRFGRHLGFFVLLSMPTCFLLANCSDTWKEITTAFVPQLYTVIFNLVEHLYKVQVVESENDMNVNHVVHRGCDLVVRLLEHVLA